MDSDKEVNTQTNGVSIIICCYNSSKRIETTLHHLQQQECAPSIKWEVILVDNASTDQTSEVVLRQWNINPVVPLKLVAERNPGLMYARLAGLNAASYDVISFVDDDNWVESRWVDKIFTLFHTNAEIAACGGRGLPHFDTTPPSWFTLYENSYAVGQQMSRSGYIDEYTGYLWGAGLSFRKSLWDKLQSLGFKNLTIGREGSSINAGEDTELCYAFRLLGYRLYYSDDLVYYHQIPRERLTFNYLKKMVTGFGKANVRLNCYRVLLYPDSFTLRNWLVEFAYSFKSYLKDSLLAVVARNESKRDKFRLSAQYWYGSALQLWSDKSNLHQMVKATKSTFSNKAL